MKKNFHGSRLPLAGMMLLTCLTVTGCSSGSEASRGAKQGAATGAVAGAVGGMVTALVFGGNVAEAGARGAVAGGSSGAVVGGMSGAQRDKQQEQRLAAEQNADVEKLRQRIGDDAFSGVVALAHCKHGVARANADVALRSENSDHALAGEWIHVLSSADQRDEAGARARFPRIIELDAKIADATAAEQAMREAMQKLMEIRESNGLPKVCPT